MRNQVNCGLASPIFCRGYITFLFSAKNTKCPLLKLFYICAVLFLIATVPSAHDVESVSFFAATTMDDVYLPLSLFFLGAKKDFFALMEHASSSFRRKRELDQKIVKKEELAF